MVRRPKHRADDSGSSSSPGSPVVATEPDGSDTSPLADTPALADIPTPPETAARAAARLDSALRRIRANALVVVTVSVLALTTAGLAAAVPNTVTSTVAGAEVADLAGSPTSPPAPTSASSAGSSPASSPPPAPNAVPPPAAATQAAPAHPSTVHSGPPAKSSAHPPTAPDPIAEAVVQADQIAAGYPSMALGIAVIDLHTGELVEGTLGTQPFYAASLTKLLLAVDIMTRRETSDLPIPDADELLLTQALGPSDDEAMNALWVTYDGPSAVERVAQTLGLHETMLAPDSSQWGEVTVSARDMATVLKYMMSELSPSDRAFLVDSMQAAPGSAADGFDQAFGLLSPLLRAGHETEATGPIAKQGWMELIGGVLSLNSVGVVGGNSGYAVALLSSQAVAGDWDWARQQLTTVSDSLTASLS